MAPQDAPRTRPRRLQDASKTTSNRFESEVASYIAFGTPKLPPNGFQNRSKMLPERLLRPCQFRQTERQRDTQTGIPLLHLPHSTFKHGGGSCEALDPPPPSRSACSKWFFSANFCLKISSHRLRIIRHPFGFD